MKTRRARNSIAEALLSSLSVCVMKRSVCRVCIVPLQYKAVFSLIKISIRRFFPEFGNLLATILVCHRVC